MPGCPYTTTPLYYSLHKNFANVNDFIEKMQKLSFIEQVFLFSLLSFRQEESSAMQDNRKDLLQSLFQSISAQFFTS